MHYRFQGLAQDHFSHLIGAEGGVLQAAGAIRMRITQAHAAPCRISLDDAAIGETVLLLNHEHQPAATPYRASGPIFIREAPAARYDASGAIPPALARRLLSLRAYDAAGMMIDAEVVEGAACEAVLDRLFADERAAVVHAHYARRGCYAALITRG